MNPAHDWKWRLALGAFVIFAGFVWFWPLPAPPPPESAPAEAEEAEQPEALATEDMLRYTVQAGDTAYGIARLFVVDETLLRRVNRVPPGGDFEPGTLIRIPPQTP